MSEATQPLRTVVVGCGGMGRNQARILAHLDDYDLVAVCDAAAENAEIAAEKTDARACTDYARMLADEKPDVVAVCTPNDSHAALTIEAARAGVRGVHCEKPMATNMADARAMVRACEESGVALVVNHQRRLGTDVGAMRRLMDAGAVGDVRLIRGQCAGDVLSDGSHLIDSLMFLTGDGEAEWVLGQVHREPPGEPAEPDAGKGFEAESGLRYGHPVETGALAVVQLRSGPRLEILCGDMREEGRVYQDYEVFGTRGRLWRTDDASDPNVFVQDEEGGRWCAGWDEWKYKPVPAEDGAPGGWRPVELEPRDGKNLIAKSYEMFAKTVREGSDHPMSGAAALRGFEVLMAIYESARLRRKIALPLDQDRFPLQIMIDAGEM